MIFATVGTHTSGFDRLVRAVDEYAALRHESVLIQYGHSKYRPVNAEGFPFCSSEEMQTHYRSARVVVAHAGAGTLIEALKTNATVIVLPRLKQYQEHMDDHQIELASALHAQSRVHMVLDVTELPRLICEAMTQGVPLRQQHGEATLVPYLRQLLASIGYRRRGR